VSTGFHAPTKALWATGFLALLLVGCGQKGPLYRPEKAPQPEKETSQAPAASPSANADATTD